MGGDASSGVAQGATLARFAEAVVGEDERASEAARREMLERLGSDELVDAAAVVANFNMMTRIADSTGIPLDAGLDLATQGMRSGMGADELASAANTPRAGLLFRSVGRILEPLAPLVLKIEAALQRRRMSG